MRTFLIPFECLPNLHSQSKSKQKALKTHRVSGFSLICMMGSHHHTQKTYFKEILVYMRLWDSGPAQQRCITHSYKPQPSQTSHPSYGGISTAPAPTQSMNRLFLNLSDPDQVFLLLFLEYPVVFFQLFCSCWIVTWTSRWGVLELFTLTRPLYLHHGAADMNYNTWENSIADNPVALSWEVEHMKTVLCNNVSHW